MIVFPAIDLKAGQVVRLAEGDMARATIYNDDPAAQALLFAQAGSQYLHVVDLDGSFAGRAENRDAVDAIIEVFPGHIQLGGGIRDARAVERTDAAIQVPHMGWNDVELTAHAALIEAGEAYFLHAYHFVPDEPRHIAAMTDHGGGLVAAVARDTIAGVQFHPEKSQAYGLALLADFLEWRP